MLASTTRVKARRRGSRQRRPSHVVALSFTRARMSGEQSAGGAGPVRRRTYVVGRVSWGTQLRGENEGSGRRTGEGEGDGEG